MLGMISCKEASFLGARKEEGKLTFSEKWKLGMHMAMCGICKIVSLQNKFVALHARQVEQNISENISLPPQDKEEIKQQLK